jgi:SAM-dependent methyltransferase
VLDLGTGTGWVAQAAAARCRYAIGIDISPHCIVQARTNAQKANTTNIAYGLADITVEAEVRRAIEIAAQALEVGPVAEFDVVFLSRTLSLIPEGAHLPLLRFVRDLIKPGGKLVFDYESPMFHMQTVEVNYSINPHSPMAGGLEMETAHSVLRRYVGSDDGVHKAREAALTLLYDAGWVSTVTTAALPDWQAAGYTDATHEVRLRAARLATERGKPVAEWPELENARLQIHSGLLAQFYDTEAEWWPRGVGERDVRAQVAHKMAAVLVVATK